MQNIVIIGYGYVGKVVANLFKDHYKISVYDPPLLESMKIGNKGIRSKLEEGIQKPKKSQEDETLEFQLQEIQKKLDILQG